MQVSYDPLLLALSINLHHSSYRLLKKGRAFSVNVEWPFSLSHYMSDSLSRVPTNLDCLGELRGAPAL
jgi:flavin reductase (DIM6/NTAB) family NADH-FMN oxidoreductase RutF